MVNFHSCSEATTQKIYISGYKRKYKLIDLHDRKLNSADQGIFVPLYHITPPYKGGGWYQEMFGSRELAIARNFVFSLTHLTNKDQYVLKESNKFVL